MTDRWLLAAEADQIQDLVFRAAHLREVVGGSQLVERFCREAPALLLDQVVGQGRWSNNDLIIHRGGAFRILFDQQVEAVAFGHDLASAYRRLTGGSLSVAKPVRCSDGQYQEANNAAHAGLVAAKRRGSTPIAEAQLPFAAFCAACGIGIAVGHNKRRDEDDERADYVCEDCHNKFREPYAPGLGAQGHQPFLDNFRDAVQRQLPHHHPLHRPPGGDWATMIGQLDPNRHVAYLSADGNSMGEVFSACTTPGVTQKLSAEIASALRNALASQCAALISLRPEVDDNAVEDPKQPKKPRRELLPVLPLIIGGDDLFALLPAPWAIDITRRLIGAYERRMGTVMSQLKLTEDGAGATLSAAIVICKANYPHTLARRRCEHELAQAKRIAHGSGKGSSVLTVAVITGNQTGGGKIEDEQRVEPTLTPFEISATGKQQDLLDGLFRHRGKLVPLPQKRRVALERLFGEVPPGSVPRGQSKGNALDEQWVPRLNALRARIAREPKHDAALENALIELGDAETKERGYWRETQRPWRPEQTTYGHGLPDVLRLWHFLGRVDPNDDEQEVAR